MFFYYYDSFKGISHNKFFFSKKKLHSNIICVSSWWKKLKFVLFNPYLEYLFVRYFMNVCICGCSSRLSNSQFFCFWTCCSQTKFHTEINKITKRINAHSTSYMYILMRKQLTLLFLGCLSYGMSYLVVLVTNLKNICVVKFHVKFQKIIYGF